VKVEHVDLFLKYAKIAILVSIVISFILRWFNPEWWTDLTYYYDFVAHFPEMYSTETWGSYAVLYLPYFAALFWPATFLPEQVSFIMFTAINIPCTLKICEDSKKISPSFAVGTHMLLFAGSMLVGSCANVETLLLMVHVWAYVKIKQNHTIPIWLALLLSVASFKVYNLLFFVLYAFEVPRKDLLKAFAILLLTQVGFNLPFILADPRLRHPSFILEVLTHPRLAMTEPLMWTIRTLFTVSVLGIVLRIREALQQRHTAITPPPPISLFLGTNRS